MKFEVGQLVKIVGCENPAKEGNKLIGKITEVVRGPFLAVNAHSGAVAEVYEVAMNCPCPENHLAAFRPEHLELIPGGDEPTTWDEGIFRPLETIT